MLTTAAVTITELRIVGYTCAERLMAVMSMLTDAVSQVVSGTRKAEVSAALNVLTTKMFFTPSYFTSSWNTGAVVTLGSPVSSHRILESYQSE